MPTAPPRACSVPGCGGFVFEHGVCEGHKDSSLAKRLLIQLVDRNKRPWRALYNTKRWKDLRLLILRRDPICTKCNRNPSTVADHIHDHKGDLQLFYDVNNLHGLCKPCHDEKTGSTFGQGGTVLPPAKPSLDSQGGIIDYGEQAARNGR